MAYGFNNDKSKRDLKYKEISDYTIEPVNGTTISNIIKYRNASGSVRIGFRITIPSGWTGGTMGARINVPSGISLMKYGNQIAAQITNIGANITGIQTDFLNNVLSLFFHTNASGFGSYITIDVAEV